MVRMMVTLDERLIEEAKRLSGAKTKRAVIVTALTDYVTRLRRRRLLEQAGTLPLNLTRAELRRWRSMR
ncbi:MAG: type II toxin-antitoxin system VapB family antitoxin [Armatimonadetes bacterium]|nr:type II toxin-antitoxin system VapB family antitoxin [Armatimonadota bacterium]